jgi:hypothetical protein
VAFGRCRKRRGGTPTGERARSGGSAQADHPWREPHPLVRIMKHCVCRRSASFIFVLSSLPAQAKQSSSLPCRPGLRRRGACHRAARLRAGPLAPRNDDRNRGLFDIVDRLNSRAFAPRERRCLSRTKRYSPISRKISAVCSPSRGEGRSDAIGVPSRTIGVRMPGIVPPLAASLLSSSRMPR